jgi:hypothetical protein
MTTTKHRIQFALSLAAASMLAAQPASADVEHDDDVIITGQLCAGSDNCKSGRVFQADLELASVNPNMILFDSTAGADDWEIGASNDDLIIKNRVDGGATVDVFHLDGGAPASSLYVNGLGRVGLGTSSPVDHLHMTGFNPAIRFEDFAAPRTWVAGVTGGGFAVADLTSGTSPFSIAPGPPNNSLRIASSGNVGLGTNTPAAGLHVRRIDGTAKLFVEEASAGQASRTLFQLQNNGEPKFGFKNTAFPQSWEFFASVGFAVNEITNPGLEFVLSPSGSLTITGSLEE